MRRSSLDLPNHYLMWLTTEMRRIQNKGDESEFDHRAASAVLVALANAKPIQGEDD